MNKKETLNIIIKAAREYQSRLENQHFLIVYQEALEIRTATVGFRDMNFMHLTGVTSRLSAKQFYLACLAGKLSEQDFEIDKKGKVQQKLQVLPHLAGLLYNNCMIGTFINSGVYIRADYFVGNTKAVLSVGFRYGKGADYPVTLYKENVKKLTKPTCKVLAIFSKRYNQLNYYACTYLSKGQDVEELSILLNLKFDENK